MQGDTRGVATDIRFGMISQLQDIETNLTRVVSGYAQGQYMPQDADYDHLVNEMRTIRIQLGDFIQAKLKQYKDDDLKRHRAIIEEGTP